MYVLNVLSITELVLSELTYIKHCIDLQSYTIWNNIVFTFVLTILLVHNELNKQHLQFTPSNKPILPVHTIHLDIFQL